MLVRCWGARGSLPVSGGEYLRYGGDTPCIELRTADDRIVIIDAGSGIRRLGNRLVSEKRRAFTLFLTHAHWDHIMGFPFFKPVYRSTTRISLFGCPFAQSSVREIISGIMSPPNFPVNFEAIRADIRYTESCLASFEIGAMRVTPIAISHPNQGIGYPLRRGWKILRLFDRQRTDVPPPGGASLRGIRGLRQGGRPSGPRRRVSPPRNTAGPGDGATPSTRTP